MHVAVKNEFYRKLREEAEKRAQLARQKAEEDKEYLNLKQSCDMLFWKFLRERDPELRKLIEDEYTKAKEEEQKRLEVLGIDRRSFDVRTYCRCLRCNDTGLTLYNGDPCDCEQILWKKK